MTPDRLKELRKIAEAANIVEWPLENVDHLHAVENFHNATTPELVLSLLDLIDRQREALERADDAINPKDREGISLDKWNTRLKEATAFIRSTLEAGKSSNEKASALRKAKRNLSEHFQQSIDTANYPATALAAQPSAPADGDARNAALEEAYDAATAYLKAILKFLKETRPNEDPGNDVEAAMRLWSEKHRALKSSPPQARNASMPTEEMVARLIDPDAFGYGDNARDILKDSHRRNGELEALEKARAILALFQAQGSGERGWRTIDSAPKDGQDILLWWRLCTNPSVGRWSIDDAFDEHDEGWPCPEEGWRSDGDQCIPRNQSDCTHWMPLPAAPDTDMGER